MKTVFSVLGAIFGTIVLVFALSFLGTALGVLSLPFHMASNTVETGHGVIDKTINADNAIYNYEYFRQAVEDIKAMNNKVELSKQATLDFKATYGDPSTWSYATGTEYSRLQAVQQGQESMLEDMIATYNARSNMANRNIFQDGLIPSALEIGSEFLK